MPLGAGYEIPEAQSAAALLAELRAIRLGIEVLTDEDLNPEDEEVEE